MRSKRKQKELKDTLIYTVPAILLVTIMMYIPFVMSGYYSLTEWNGIAKNAAFVGLDNFRKIFSS
ncbi:MAG: sugar ABC transporter permease, partial [Blautia sp.]|nr:sugar ABC transporter permease [Blautia sp.]